MTSWDSLLRQEYGEGAMTSHEIHSGLPLMLGSGLGKSGGSGHMVSKKLSLQSQFLSITSIKGSRCVFLGGQSKDNGRIQTGVQERGLPIGSRGQDGRDSGRKKKLPE